MNMKNIKTAIMINEIKSLLNKNKSISEISEILKIKRTTLYGI